MNYKYRVHDPRLGRFLSIDPLAPEYPWNSPYAFSENRVIDGVELEGREFINKTQARSVSGGRPALRTTRSVSLAPPPRIIVPQAPYGQSNYLISGGRSYVVPGRNPIVVNPSESAEILESNRLLLGQIRPGDASLHSPERAALIRFKGNSRSDTNIGGFIWPGIQPIEFEPGNKSTPIPKDNSGVTFGTYTKSRILPNGRVQVYSGRTSGIGTLNEIVAERDKRHKELRLKGYGPAVPDKASQNPGEIRGREQQLIDYHGKSRTDRGNSGNDRRGVGKDEPNGKAWHDAASQRWGEKYEYTGNQNL